MRPRRGQVMVLLALFLPLVMLPILAYTVQSALVSSRSAALQAAVARAAEDATTAIDVGALRATGSLRLDPVAAPLVAGAALAGLDPGATVDQVVVAGRTVTVSAHEGVGAGFGGLLGFGPITLHASATAEISAGYSSPSSLVPFPNRSLSMTG